MLEHKNISLAMSNSVELGEIKVKTAKILSQLHCKCAELLEIGIKTATFSRGPQIFLPRAMTELCREKSAHCQALCQAHHLFFILPLFN